MELDELEKDISHTRFRLKRAMQHDWLREVDQYTFELSELEKQKAELLEKQLPNNNSKQIPS